MRGLEARWARENRQVMSLKYCHHVPADSRTLLTRPSRVSSPKNDAPRVAETYVLAVRPGEQSAHGSPS
jgi:hypothetical protein